MLDVHHAMLEVHQAMIDAKFEGQPDEEDHPISELIGQLEAKLLHFKVWVPLSISWSSVLTIGSISRFPLKIQ